MFRDGTPQAGSDDARRSRRRGTCAKADGEAVVSESGAMGTTTSESIYGRWHVAILLSRFPRVVDLSLLLGVQNRPNRPTADIGVISRVSSDRFELVSPWPVIIYDPDISSARGKSVFGKHFRIVGAVGGGAII